jgi:hypothetical protein
MQGSLTEPAARRPRYGLIFLGLVAVTLVELAISIARVPSPLSTGLTLSSLKAAGRFHMHLRGQSLHGRLHRAVLRPRVRLTIAI